MDVSIAAKYANEAIASVRKEQALQEEIDAQRRLESYLNTLTPEAWRKAGEQWARLTQPSQSTCPSIEVTVCSKDVPALEAELGKLGYTITVKRIPESKERGYEWDAHHEVRIFVPVLKEFVPVLKEWNAP